MKICLLNDSFPPKIDGVANTVLNYAQILTSRGHEVAVATPYYPDVSDDYPFKVIRYPSLDTQKFLGYRAGFPFSAKAVDELCAFDPDIIHTHCPVISTILARHLRDVTGAPIVITYHTKFDIDIETLIKAKAIQKSAIRLLVDNISACDRVWAVSNGAAENLCSLGYNGDYTVMRNGADMTPRRSSDERIKQLAEEYKIDLRFPCYLFVGRLQWYKGIRLILNALSQLSSSNRKYTMLFVGSGANQNEMEEYASKLGIRENCIFTGPVYDREKLRDFYSMSDLFLFPSTFDTNGLVVREAAACETPCALIEGSAAAEGIVNGVDGFLFRENTNIMNGLYGILDKTYDNRSCLRTVGKNAQKNLYISWETSVINAENEYVNILKQHQPRVRNIYDSGELMISAAGELYLEYTKMRRQNEKLLNTISGARDDIKEKLESVIDEANDNLEITKASVEVYLSEIKEFFDKNKK